MKTSTFSVVALMETFIASTTSAFLHSLADHKFHSVSLTLPWSQTACASTWQEVLGQHPECRDVFRFSTPLAVPGRSGQQCLPVWTTPAAPLPTERCMSWAGTTARAPPQSITHCCSHPLESRRFCQRNG